MLAHIRYIATSALLVASIIIWPINQVTAAPGPGSLIKIACASNTGANDPCRAVYYYGGDGRRHAFPNDRVYFSWYTNFANIQTVSKSFLASLPLGSNVTYRPGVKLVKFVSLNNVYAVALGGELRWVQTENLARDLYGTDWNQQIDDINDAFFPDYRIGEDIASLTAYNKNNELTLAQNIDANLADTFRTSQITTARGVFNVEVITMHRKSFNMLSVTAQVNDCSNNCEAKSLQTFATESIAAIGINGSYFCPPDYPECANKINTFLWPFYNSLAGVMRNTSSLAVHNGPLLATTTDGRYFFFHRAKEFGNSVADFESRHQAKLASAVTNFPSLVENGTVVAENESSLDENMRTLKGTRGAIGYNDRFVYLVVAHSATVIDLAYILQAIGATSAMNLDGGGSAALLYNNIYKVGPGRLLPNAILFKKIP